MFADEACLPEKNGTAIDREQLFMLPTVLMICCNIKDGHSVTIVTGARRKPIGGVLQANSGGNTSCWIELNDFSPVNLS